MKPYPYQRTCLNALGAARKSGRKRALAVMATGLGKTVVSAFEIKRLLKQAPGRVLYLCHNNDILRQARKTFEEVLGDSYTHGYFHGTEKHAHVVDVLYASFGMMHRRRKQFKRDEFRYIVVDEVHHAHAATFRPTIEYFQPDWMVGLTATPERSDGLDISTLFEGKPVFELGIFKALARRHLCDIDYRIMTDEIQRLEVLDTPIGKLSIAELNRTVFVPKRDKEIARIIQQKAAEEFETPRVMIFCESIEHANRMAVHLPHAVVVHSDLKTAEKNERLAAFRSGEADTIITVDMLNEGIDVPEANVIVFLRSTASRRIFLQQLGRGLRKALGKLKVLVLDFVANCERIEMIDQLQQGVREALNALPSGPKADGEAGETHAFTLTLDGGEFDERVWRLLNAVKEIRQTFVPPNFYTTSLLTEQLLNKARQLGRTPKKQEVDADPAMAYSGTFIEVFRKTWNEVLEEVGLSANWQGDYNSDELRAQLVRKAKELGRSPTQKEVASDPAMASPNAFKNHLGKRWNAVLEAAGLDPNYRPNYTHEDLVVQLLHKANELGRTPTQKEVDEDPNMASDSTFMSQFQATWTEIVESVGLEAPNKICSYSKEDLERQLLQKADTLGRVPTRREVANDPSMASVSTFLKILNGTWNEITERVFKQEGNRRRPYTIEELTLQLRKKVEELGRLPRGLEVHQDPNMASEGAFKRAFGRLGWDEIFRITGLKD